MNDLVFRISVTLMPDSHIVSSGKFRALVSFKIVI